MSSGNIRVPFQPCRRSGAGERLFLPVRLRTVDYLLRFTDGAHERYQVAYIASLEARKFRQHWRYRGHVSRQISIYNRAGEQFEKVNADRRLDPSIQDSRDAIVDWRDWHECAFNHDTATPEDEFGEIFHSLTRAFAASIIADKRQVEAHFQRMYKGIEALSEID